MSICKDYESKLNLIRERASISNFFEQLFGVLNARDNVYKQMLRSIMYRKQMLWMDIGIKTSEYVHEESKRLVELIHEKQEELGYAPTQLEFAPPTFEEGGYWTLGKNVGREGSSLVTMFSVVNNDIKEVNNVIKNYSRLND